MNENKNVQEIDDRKILLLQLLTLIPENLRFSSSTLVKKEAGNKHVKKKNSSIKVYG